MKKFSLYVISGLCADERMFQRIHFPEYADVHFVKWEKPLTNESLENYITRLLQKFDLTKPVVLLGLSFGGVVVQEVARKINPKGTIIISSISSPREMPWYFRMAQRVGLYRIAPFGLLRSMSAFARRIFGATQDDTKKLLAQYSKECDVDLLKWSVKQILLWRGEKCPGNFFHIHGSSDRLLPLKNKNVDAVIEGGGHFMVYEQGEKIEIILGEQLERIAQKL